MSTNPFTTRTNENVEFLTVAQFKAMTGATKFELIKNPNTNKLFWIDEFKNKYRSAQEISLGKPIAIVVEDGDIATACFINTKESANVLGSL